jgi:hypothetical protein
MKDEGTISALVALIVVCVVLFFGADLSPGDALCLGGLVQLFVLGLFRGLR